MSFQKHPVIGIGEDNLQTCIRYRPKITGTNQNNNNICQSISMSIEEYFYGVKESKGVKRVKERKIFAKYNCTDCSKILYNNLRLMGHMKHKVSKILSKHGGKHDSHICLSCFKVFETRYLLDCHTTTVHTYENSTRVCRICKEDFKTERTFFSHMKDLHGFKEMPYICKVCKFQSSHYDDIISHYKNYHKDSRTFLCCFCLQVFNSAAIYMKHCMLHSKKNKNKRCSRCTLLFLDETNLGLHVDLDHCSHNQLFNGNINTVEICVYDIKSHNKQALESSNQLLNALHTDSTNIQEVRMLWMHVNVPHICYGCKKTINGTSASFKLHFSVSYSCKMCQFQSCCLEESKNHTLKYHKSNIFSPNGQQKKTNKRKITPPLDALSKVDDKDVGGITELPTSFVAEHFKRAKVSKKIGDIASSLAQIHQVSSNKSNRRKQLVPMKMESPDDNDTLQDFSVDYETAIDYPPSGEVDVKPFVRNINAFKARTPSPRKPKKTPKRKRKKAEKPKKTISKIAPKDLPKSRKDVYNFQLLTSNKGIGKNSNQFLLVSNAQKRQMVLSPLVHKDYISHYKTQVALKDKPKPPLNVQIVELKVSSIIVGWCHPLNCSVTQYRVSFKGMGNPTTQFLPPHQTLVRLVGLKSNTQYTVRIFSLYKSEQSLYSEIKCKTLKQNETTAKCSDEVIVVEDDDLISAIPQMHALPPTKTKQFGANGAKRLVVDAKSLLNMNTPMSGLVYSANNKPLTIDTLNQQFPNIKAPILVGPIPSTNLPTSVLNTIMTSNNSITSNKTLHPDPSLMALNPDTLSAAVSAAMIQKDIEPVASKQLADIDNMTGIESGSDNSKVMEPLNKNITTKDLTLPLSAETNPTKKSSSNIECDLETSNNVSNTTTDELEQLHYEESPAATTVDSTITTVQPNVSHSPENVVNTIDNETVLKKSEHAGNDDNTMLPHSIQNFTLTQDVESVIEGLDDELPDLSPSDSNKSANHAESSKSADVQQMHDKINADLVQENTDYIPEVVCEEITIENDSDIVNSMDVATTEIL